jgi:hypothetical protein
VIDAALRYQKLGCTPKHSATGTFADSDPSQHILQLGMQLLGCTFENFINDLVQFQGRDLAKVISVHPAKIALLFPPICDQTTIHLPHQFFQLHNLLFQKARAERAGVCIVFGGATEKIEKDLRRILHIYGSR